MSEKNLRVVRDFIEAGNEGKIEKIRTLCSGDCIYKGMPYVGCGFNVDDSDGKRVLVTATIPGAPSEGKLLAGDEILSVREGGRIHEGFTDLHMSPWGPGIPGHPVEFRIKRGGRETEVTVTRGRIPAYEVPIGGILDSMEIFFRGWPDHREEVELIVDGGDYVMVHSMMSGTCAELGRGAFWATSSLYRIRDGKIVELRGVDDSLSQYRQLGYAIVKPGKRAGG